VCWGPAAVFLEDFGDVLRDTGRCAARGGDQRQKLPSATLTYGQLQGDTSVQMPRGAQGKPQARQLRGGRWFRPPRPKDKTTPHTQAKAQSEPQPANKPSPTAGQSGAVQSASPQISPRSYVSCESVCEAIGDPSADIFRTNDLLEKTVKARDSTIKKLKAQVRQLQNREGQLTAQYERAKRKADSLVSWKKEADAIFGKRK